MADLTPLNRFTTPNEREQPYFPSMKAFFLGVDASIYADSDNGNLTFDGGGLFSWEATTGLLTWSTPVTITGFTTNYTAVIQGPPLPGGQLTLNDGEVAFFVMPRQMQSTQIVPLITSTRIFQSNGTRLNDLRLFCARVGDTVLFPYGKSLLTGESAVLFGGGVGNTVPPHVHQPALVIEPPTIGISTLDLQIVSFVNEGLVLSGIVGIFDIGDTVTGGTTGTTATVAGTAPNEILVNTIVGSGFVLGEHVTSSSTDDAITLAAIVGIISVGDIVTAGSGTGKVLKIVGAVYTIKVTAGTFPGSGAFTDTTSGATATITSTVVIGNPAGDIVSIIAPSNLIRVDIFRNGALLSQGATRDYTINYTTGIVTLTLPTATTTERFVALRETTPSGAISTEHQHKKLLIEPISGVSILDMQITSLDNPALVDINLYRNGALLAEPADYTLDLTTGLVTLTIATVTSERFVADRLEQ